MYQAIFKQTVLLECINERYHTAVLLEYIDHSLQFSQILDIAININFTLPYYADIMLIMLSMTYYAQNYAGIIGGCLIRALTKQY